MTSPRRTITRTQTIRFNRNRFSSLFEQFVNNKYQIKSLELRNEGAKKDGIKFDLLSQALEHGERDPETGSFYLTFDSPIEDSAGVKWVGFKAERRAPKTLNVDRASDFLESKGLLEDCQRHVLTLTLN